MEARQDVGGPPGGAKDEAGKVRRQVSVVTKIIQRVRPRGYLL